MNAQLRFSRTARTAMLAGAAIVGIGSSTLHLTAFTGDQVLGCGSDWTDCQYFGSGVIPCDGSQGAGGSWPVCDTNPSPYRPYYCVAGSGCS